METCAVKKLWPCLTFGATFLAGEDVSRVLPMCVSCCIVLSRLDMENSLKSQYLSKGLCDEKVPAMCRTKGGMFEILGSISTKIMMLKNALHILELIQTPECKGWRQE